MIAPSGSAVCHSTTSSTGYYGTRPTHSAPRRPCRTTTGRCPGAARKEEPRSDLAHRSPCFGVRPRWFSLPERLRGARRPGLLALERQPGRTHSFAYQIPYLDWRLQGFLLRIATLPEIGLRGMRRDQDHRQPRRRSARRTAGFFRGPQRRRDRDASVEPIFRASRAASSRLPWPAAARGRTVAVAGRLGRARLVSRCVQAGAPCF